MVPVPQYVAACKEFVEYIVEHYNDTDPEQQKLVAAAYLAMVAKLKGCIGAELDVALQELGDISSIPDDSDVIINLVIDLNRKWNEVGDILNRDYPNPGRYLKPDVILEDWTNAYNKLEEEEESGNHT